MHFFKQWWWVIVLVILVLGGLWWWFGSYRINTWWTRITNPSFEYADYTRADGPSLTDEEITEHAKAVKLVESQPEVLALFANLGPKQTTSEGCHRFTELDHRRGDIYAVKVYDVCGLSSPVLVWYEVNRKTWEVRKIGK